MMSDLQTLELDRSIAEICGKVSAQLSEIGKPPGTPDMLIAATALVHDLTLVTHNVRDFHRVPGLRIQDWITP
jgi:tRNA(fMet)-specific endonuclease VapC